jgi:hypothetical protein
VNVATVPPAFIVTAPGVVWFSASTTWKEVDRFATARSKPAASVVSSGTAVALSTGVCVVRTGGSVIVNDHDTGTGIFCPSAVAAPETVAVYTAPGASGALGVKRATVEASRKVSAPGTLLLARSRTVNDTDAGTIGWLNVAVAGEFNGTSVAFAAGVRALRTTCGAAVVNEKAKGAAIGTPPKFVAPLVVTVNFVDGVKSASGVNVASFVDASNDRVPATALPSWSTTVICTDAGNSAWLKVTDGVALKSTCDALSP